MRSRLCRFVSICSLLLFVAVCVLWVRSYWRADLILVAGYEVMSDQGKLAAGRLFDDDFKVRTRWGLASANLSHRSVDVSENVLLFALLSALKPDRFVILLHAEVVAGSGFVAAGAWRLRRARSGKHVSGAVSCRQVLRRHPLFTVAAAVSLLLLLAFCVMWAASCRAVGRGWGVTWVQHGRPDARGLHVVRTRFVAVADGEFRSGATASGYSGESLPRSGVSWGAISSNRYAPLGSQTKVWFPVTLPAWLVALVMAALPVWWLRVLWRQRRSEQRRAASCCLQCGYDLRATPDRCPECGAASAAR